MVCPSKLRIRPILKFLVECKWKNRDQNLGFLGIEQLHKFYIYIHIGDGNGVIMLSTGVQNIVGVTFSGSSELSWDR